MDANETLNTLTERLPELSTELRKAGVYLLENASLIGINSARAMARSADVKPNTLVRLSKELGLPGYEAFRQPFRAQLVHAQDPFAEQVTDRAMQLQSLHEDGDMGSLHQHMATACTHNIQQFFEAHDQQAMEAAAQTITQAGTVYVLGVGIANVFAKNFAYIASMAMDKVVELPREGALPIDGMVRAKAGDVLLAVTFKPYRREVVEAVEEALRQGVTVIGISDSPAAPHLSKAAHRFVVSTDTPQFFTSTVALMAFMETLAAYVIAASDDKVIESIERFHQRRHELGIYLSEQQNH